MVGISPSRSYLLTLPSMHSSQIHHPVSCLGALAPPAQLLRTFYYFCLYLSRLYLFTEAMFKGDHLFQVPWYTRSQLIRPSSSIPLSAGTLSMWGFHGKHLVTCPSVLPDYELHEAKVDVLFMKSQHLVHHIYAQEPTELPWSCFHIKVSNTWCIGGGRGIAKM